MSNVEQEVGLFYLKRGILLFWGVWFLIAFLTNVTDFLCVVHAIPLTLFRSGNCQLLSQVLGIYHSPEWLLRVFFGGDIFAQGLSAGLFFAAAFYFGRRQSAWRLVNLAFGVSMLLWACFLAMLEVFIGYPHERAIFQLLLVEMVSLMIIHLLPAGSAN